MKKTILVLLLFINANTFAQKQEAFFCRDSANIKNIANLIIENTKNKYQLDKVISHRQDVEFWYRYEKYNLVRIHFKFFPDRSAVLAGLTGNYEDIFPFWKRYFQQDADSSMLAKERGAKLVTTPFLNGTAEFNFLKVANPLWQIKPVYKVDPTKK
jgi:hypothetical protein